MLMNADAFSDVSADSCWFAVSLHAVKYCIYVHSVQTLQLTISVLKTKDFF